METFWYWLTQVHLEKMAAKMERESSARYYTQCSEKRTLILFPVCSVNPQCFDIWLSDQKGIQSVPAMLHQYPRFSFGALGLIWDNSGKIGQLNKNQNSSSSSSSKIGVSSAVAKC